MRSTQTRSVTKHNISYSCNSWHI